ncbi:MAG TPA: prolyl oligopeptidase family serine peptidase [Steroidobacteraceae bacterium]|jgi:prolyl oligopeptidase|nr:prolyl oligopeptidase family serine peptidase [Steroidobacteraceae bacterium]
MPNRLIALAIAALGASSAIATADDPYVWLEEASSDRAIDWVKAENAKTVAVLEGDARYADIHAKALAIASARDRIPEPGFRAGRLYNFWQDAEHARGIWRSATLEQYRRDAPHWQNVLDLDALATQEHANWYWKGAECLQPSERRCLLSLSDGGEDAVTVREFDLTARRFVGHGFQLPAGKQEAAWIDRDHLLVARDWGPGTMTTSGYPFVAKILERGRPLESAHEVFRGKAAEVGVEVARLDDGSGHQALLILRNIAFFENEIYLLVGGAPRRLALPLKAEIAGLAADRLLIKLNETWSAEGHDFPSGCLISLELPAAAAEPAQLRPVLVYAPAARESVGSVGATHSKVILTLLRNVKGRVVIFSPAPNRAWTQQELSLPDNAAVDIVATDPHSERAFLDLQGFLTPPGLWLVDATTRARARIKSLPARFDAAGATVEQFEARSSDGTLIPYFVVHPAVIKLDGQNPTVLYAYGGFQISETPSYLDTIGKLWLEKGGVFVLANIRGGGEFGPAWHEAGLKTHRQIIYDDFAAVARDLIARHITSPRRLGIQGGSNGGLLMGVEFTQHPELWNAVDIQVPLLDMLRFEKIDAGSSWVGEYGSVSNPDEAAFLARISPYSNIRRGEHYPEPLIWTTAKDDRVGPQHARKFAARLAEYGIPYLFYEVIEGGHAAGANIDETAHTDALEMTYFTRKLMDR